MFFFSIAAVPMDMKCPGARRRCPRPPAPCPRRAVPRARGSHLHSKYMFAWTNWLRGSWWYPHRADVEAVAVRRIEEQFRFWYPRWLEAQASILPSHFMSFIFKKRNERTKGGGNDMKNGGRIPRRACTSPYRDSSIWHFYEDILDMCAYAVLQFCFDDLVSNALYRASAALRSSLVFGCKNQQHFDIHHCTCCKCFDLLLYFLVPE